MMDRKWTQMQSLHRLSSSDQSQTQDREVTLEVLGTTLMLGGVLMAELRQGLIHGMEMFTSQELQLLCFWSSQKLTSNVI
jgi:hypothetical protein